MSCNSEKIEGYDKWDVQNDASTLINAEEIKNKDKKYFAVVMKEVDKKAKASAEAALVKQEAAASLKLEKKVSKGLKKVFKKKGNPHNSDSKGGY